MEKSRYPLRFPSGLPARRELQRRSTYCCCGSPPLPDYCWTYVRFGLYLYTCGVRVCADSPLLRRLLRDWPGGAGKEGPALLFLSSPLAAARVEASSWLEELLLLLALAGPAGYLKNALLRRCLGCYVAHCA